MTPLVLAPLVRNQGISQNADLRRIEHQQEMYVYGLCFIFDPFHLVINSRRPRDIALFQKTDYANSVLNFLHDGKVVRYNWCCMDAVYNHRFGFAEEKRILHMYIYIYIYIY